MTCKLTGWVLGEVEAIASTYDNSWKDAAEFVYDQLCAGEYDNELSAEEIAASKRLLNPLT
jgi:hypothetical protein